MTAFPNLSDEEIDKIIGPDNEVRSNASKGLQKIITQITTAERSIIRSSNALFSKAKESGYLAETELGIKNGRVVLPVLSEHKRKISGVLIDQSGTGKISYIEPLELVGLNNELAELAHNLDLHLLALNIRKQNMPTSIKRK